MIYFYLFFYYNYFAFGLYFLVWTLLGHVAILVRVNPFHISNGGSLNGSSPNCLIPYILSIFHPFPHQTKEGKGKATTTYTRPIIERSS